MKEPETVFGNNNIFFGWCARGAGGEVLRVVGVEGMGGVGTLGPRTPSQTECCAACR